MNVFTKRLTEKKIHSELRVQHHMDSGVVQKKKIKQQHSSLFDYRCEMSSYVFIPYYIQYISIQKKSQGSASTKSMDVQQEAAGNHKNFFGKLLFMKSPQTKLSNKKARQTSMCVINEEY